MQHLENETCHVRTADKRFAHGRVNMHRSFPFLGRLLIPLVTKQPRTGLLDSDIEPKRGRREGEEGGKGKKRNSTKFYTKRFCPEVKNP